MLRISDQSNGTEMGAIDPIVSRNHVKLKSASIEAGNQLGTRAALRLLECVEPSQSTPMLKLYGDEEPSLKETDLDCNKIMDNFLTPSPGPLKPSVSTSCLLTAELDNSSPAEETKNTLVCVPTRASLTHEWKKLMTPNKCRECNLLVYFNGRECSFCGFVAHKKCVTVLVIKCSGQQLSESLQVKNRKDKQLARSTSSNDSSSQRSGKSSKPNIQPVFGQPIGIDSQQVVDFMRRFIYEIDTRGLTLKGIYRVSSIKSKVDKLCNYYDQNLSSLVDLSSFHPNIIANALKMYLRQLPEPLLTHQLYNSFIELAKKYSNSNSQKTTTTTPAKPKINNKLPLLPSVPPKHRHHCSLTVTTSTSSVFDNPDYNPMLIVEMQEIIEKLPPINRSLVAIIMRHLKRVDEMSEENQMSAKNLSIIFGPTLLSASNKSLAIVDNIHQARSIELMITWANQIFPLYENYESKAMIELDFEQYEEHQRLLRARLEAKGIEVDNNNNNNNNNSNITKYPDKQLRSREIRVANNEPPPPPRKTRQDLSELRKQFFTMPSSQPNVKPSDVVAASQMDNNKGKSYKSTGSLPVIKVQPCYCNKLTKQDT